MVEISGAMTLQKLTGTKTTIMNVNPLSLTNGDELDVTMNGGTLNLAVPVSDGVLSLGATKGIDMGGGSCCCGLINLA